MNWKTCDGSDLLEAFSGTAKAAINANKKLKEF
jgi:hypothetical protein